MLRAGETQRETFRIRARGKIEVVFQLSIVAVIRDIYARPCPLDFEALEIRDLRNPPRRILAKEIIRLRGNFIQTNNLRPWIGALRPRLGSNRSGRLDNNASPERCVAEGPQAGSFLLLLLLQAWP